MPYFSSEQTDADMQAAHQAIERLSDQAQRLVSEFMADAVQLTGQDAKELAGWCNRIARRLRRARRQATGETNEQ